MSIDDVEKRVARVEREVRWWRRAAACGGLAMAILLLAALAPVPPRDEITVRRLVIVDTDGRPRIVLGRIGQPSIAEVSSGYFDSAIGLADRHGIVRVRIRVEDAGQEEGEPRVELVSSDGFGLNRFALLSVDGAGGFLSLRGFADMSRHGSFGWFHNYEKEPRPDAVHATTDVRPGFFGLESSTGPAARLQVSNRGVTFRLDNHDGAGGAAGGDTIAGIDTLGGASVYLQAPSAGAGLVPGELRLRKDGKNTVWKTH